MPQNIIFLDITLTKDMKVLLTENNRTLLIEIKDLNKWRDIPCS